MYHFTLRGAFALIAVTLVWISCQGEGDSPGSKISESPVIAASASRDRVLSVNEMEAMGWEVIGDTAYKWVTSTDSNEADRTLKLATPSTYRPATPEECIQIINDASASGEYSCGYSCQDFSYSAVQACLDQGIRAHRLNFDCRNSEIPEDCPGHTRGHAILIMQVEFYGERLWCMQEPQSPLTPRPDGSTLIANIDCIPVGATWPAGSLNWLCERYGMGDIPGSAEVLPIGENNPGTLSDPTRTCTEHHVSENDSLESCQFCCGDIWFANVPDHCVAPFEVAGVDAWTESCMNSCDAKFENISSTTTTITEYSPPSSSSTSTTILEYSPPSSSSTSTTILE